VLLTTRKVKMFQVSKDIEEKKKMLNWRCGRVSKVQEKEFYELVILKVAIQVVSNIQMFRCCTDYSDRPEVPDNPDK